MSEEEKGPIATAGPFEVIQVRPLTNDEKRREWLSRRQQLVGASEIGALFGVDAYNRTITDIFDEKVGTVGEDVSSPDMERGRYLEPIILDLYQKATSRVVVPMGLQVHPAEPRMGATPDGEIVHDDKPTIEVKCVRQQKFSRLKHVGLSDSWILQAQAQMEVCDRPWSAFAFFCADSWAMVRFEIERDREIGAALLEKVREFWRLYMATGVRPLEAMVADLPEMPAVAGELVIRNDADWAEAAGLFVEARDLMRTAEEIEESAKVRIKGLMGGYGAAEGASLRAYFSQQQKTTFKKDALKAARPVDRLSLAANLMERFPELSLTDITDVIEKSRLDLSKYEVKGSPFDILRTYVLKQTVDEDRKMLPPPRLRLEP